MNRSPAFQFYPDKWQSHTRRLSDSAYRVYHELMCWMWQSSPDHCSVAARVESVSVAVAMPLECVRIAMEDIQNPDDPLLKVEGDRWVCNGLRKEALKQARRRASGVVGAYARWKKPMRAQEDTMQTHQITPKPQCLPSSSSSLIPTSMKNEDCPDRDAACRVPKTFKQWNSDDLLREVKANNADSILSEAEERDFVGYWMEPSATGRSRMSLEKTWDTRRRMQTAVRVIYEKQRKGDGFGSNRRHVSPVADHSKGF